MKRGIPYAVTGLAVALLAMMSSCSTAAPWPTSPNDPSAAATPPSDTPSIALFLEAPPELNEFRIGGGVTLTLENHSQEWIWFPTDYGLAIEAQDAATGGWRDVGNLTRYYSVDQVFLSPRDQLLWGVLLGARPDLDGFGAAVRVRISVHGKLYRQGAITDQEVQANIEVVLTP